MINDCGNTFIKKHSYKDPDYYNLETTEDQQEIEEVLYSLIKDGSGKDFRILHVGVGNSLFAVRFSPLVKEIIGLTISNKELTRGNEKKLPNYKIYNCNKYSDEFPEMIKGKFDIIVDNNPLSFSCCWVHYRKYLSRLDRYLSYKGIWFCHTLGLGYLRSYDKTESEDWKTWLNKYSYLQFKEDLKFTSLQASLSKSNPSVILLKHD